MKLYYITRSNTELTLESDNIHDLFEATSEVRQLLNQDSYIGLNNYLNHHEADCKGSVRLDKNTLVYIMEGIIFGSECRYYFKASESEHGVSLRVLTEGFTFDRITKKISTEV